MPEEESENSLNKSPAGEVSQEDEGTPSEEAPDLLQPEILKNLPDDIKRQLKIQLRSEITQGPLPPPSMLKEYELLLPGCTKQLLAHWDGQTRHRQGLECRRMSLEEKYLESSIDDAKRGQWLAFILCMSIVIAGVILAYLGYPWPGALLGGSGMASLVYAFRAGRGFSARAAARQAAKETLPSNKKIPKKE